MTADTGTAAFTAKGAFDKRTLPAPEGIRLVASSTYTAPRDSLESQLAYLWEKILSQQTIGIHDDFFEHGGHSLSQCVWSPRSKNLGQWPCR